LAKQNLKDKLAKRKQSKSVAMFVCKSRYGIQYAEFVIKKPISLSSHSRWRIYQYHLLQLASQSLLGDTHWFLQQKVVIMLLSGCLNWQHSLVNKDHGSTA